MAGRLRLPEVYRQFLPRIKEQTDAVINITTGGGHNMSIDQRLAGALSLEPEMSSLNMGSMNFGLYPALDKFQDWNHAWEPEYLEATRSGIFRNTFSDIEAILQRLGEGCGTRFEYECYDVGHLYNLAHFVDRGLAKPPLFVQTIFGVLERDRTRHREPWLICDESPTSYLALIINGRSWLRADIKRTWSLPERSWAVMSASVWRTTCISPKA